MSVCDLKCMEKIAWSDLDRGKPVCEFVVYKVSHGAAHERISIVSRIILPFVLFQRFDVLIILKCGKLLLINKKKITWLLILYERLLDFSAYAHTHTHTHEYKDVPMKQTGHLKVPPMPSKLCSMR